MRPLQSIAMGLVVVVLSARFGGYDALADPLGWLLVVLGVRRLPAPVPHRRVLLGLAALAGVVAVPLWVPGVSDDLYRLDASLGWAANLPQVAFTVALCHALAAAARAAGERGSARGLRVSRDLLVAVGLLPVLVLGAGVEQLELPAYLGATAVALVLICQLFGRSARPWVNA